MSDGLPVARVGFFVCFVGAAAAGFYAYTLNARLATARQETARAVSAQDTLKTRIATLEKENTDGAQALEGCRQTLGVTQEKLDEALKPRGSRRRG